MLSDDTIFDVVQGQTATIVSGQIRAYHDNFDFESVDRATQASNFYTESIVDPDRRGGIVKILFEGNGREIGSYSKANFDDEVSEGDDRVGYGRAAYEYLNTVLPKVKEEIGVTGDGGCFLAGTLIDMADGTRKPIGKFR